jgi:hypothetical protein
MNSTGLTSRLMARITDQPQSFEQLLDGFDKSERNTASAILSQKTTAGHLIRTGKPRDYSYALAHPAPASHAPPAAVGQPARGRMTPEQVSAAVLDLVRNTDGLTLQEITDRCDRCTAKDVKAAITELLFDMVLRTETLHGATYYVHSGAELPGPDPLAAAFVPKSTRQRVDELQAELSALLQQQAGDHASPTVLHHIAAANHHLHQLHAFID